MLCWNTVIYLRILSANYKLVLLSKTKVFCVQFYFNNLISQKHTSVSSPRKTLITTILSTKCLSYCNTSKPSHVCMPKWRPVSCEHFNFCRDHNCTMYEKTAFLHTGSSQIKSLSESQFVLLWGMEIFLGNTFFISISTNVCLVLKL